MKNETEAESRAAAQHVASAAPMLVESGEPTWHPSEGKPKKWLHAYLIYVKERKNELMKEKPHLSFKEMMQFVSASWKELDEKDRTYFQEKADLDKDRYDRQMQEYQTWGRQNPEAFSQLSAPTKKRRNHHQSAGSTSNG